MPRAGAWCHCDRDEHEPRLVVVTGGPGAGKTAVLEMARRALCGHVVVLPEAAGIVFGGGFPRDEAPAGRRAAQRVIWHAERQMEWLYRQQRQTAVVLCDRGTIDGLAYWPGPAEELLREMGTDLRSELGRYDAVVHLRTPAGNGRFNHENPLRTEDARTAREIDERILELWEQHPSRVVIDEEERFDIKAERALDAVRAQLPGCCTEAVHHRPASMRRPAEIQRTAEQ